MKTIEARFQVVTPLFCGGSDPSRPELRLPSFKGVLRYWWRALAWSCYDGKLKRIQETENRVFGSSGGGQSRVSMRLDIDSGPIRPLRTGEILREPGRGLKAVGDGARYLGYGVMEAFSNRKRGTHAGQLTRGCLLPPLDFTVRIRCRDLNESDLDLVRDALVAFGTLGGMGSKSRKGYGSIALRSMQVDGNDVWTAPHSLDTLACGISTLLRNANKPKLSDEPSGLPAYTALSKRTRVLLVSGGGNTLDLLNMVGRELVRFRSWGRNGKILGNERSKKYFKDDHDLMKRVRLGDRPRKHPRRVAFGLPHNYGHLQVKPANNDRRASPLFIHVHVCGEVSVAVISFIPARFLPADRRMILVGRSPVRQTPEEELYRPIQKFLNRLLDSDQRKEHFAAVREVTP